MYRIVLFTAALLFSTHLAAQLEEAAVADVLDRYHQAAASADWDTYFDLLSEDAVFLGTDVSERWPKAVFREYAGVLIKTGSGWQISQYHLTFPIPNALSDKFTNEIKAWEAGQ